MISVAFYDVRNRRGGRGEWRRGWASAGRIRVLTRMRHARTRNMKRTGRTDQEDGDGNEEDAETEGNGGEDRSDL